MSSQRVIDISDPTGASEHFKQKAEQEKQEKAKQRTEQDRAEQGRIFHRLSDIPQFEITDGDLIIEYVVDRLLVIATMILIAGKPKEGKSTVATAIAHSVANGIDFAGRAVKKLPVLILDRENPRSTLARRFRRIGIRQVSPGMTVFHRSVRDGIEMGPPGIDDPFYDEMITACDVKPLIVVDTLVAFYGGKSENDATEMRAFLHQLRKWCDQGCTVILIHHVAKAEGSTSRGSSDIQGMVDAHYVASNNQGGRGLDVVELKAELFREGVDDVIQLQYVDGGGFEEARPGAGLRPSGERLRDFLKLNAGISHKQFVKGVRKEYPEITEAGAETWLAKGLADGTIDMTRGTGKANKRQSYRLAEDKQGLNFDAVA